MYVGDLAQRLGVKIAEPQNVGPFLVYQGLVGIRERIVLSQKRTMAALHGLDMLVKGWNIPQVELRSYSW
jgi:hypothetical protein